MGHQINDPEIIAKMSNIWNQISAETISITDGWIRP
jgi:hypothetical protein